MARAETAELLTDRGSQAVRLPDDFRLPGETVRVRSFGRGVLLELIDPKTADVGVVFAEIDRLGGQRVPAGRPTGPTAYIHIG